MAITRSVKKGHDPPAPKYNQSSVVKHVPKKLSKPKALPRRRVAQEKNVDRLTSLPLELFKMITEGLVRDMSRMVYYHSFRRRKLYDPDRWPRTLLSRKIATDGSEEMVHMFWARKPFMDEEELSQALIHMCLSGRHDKAKKAAILIKSGASVEKYCEYNGTTPLEAAITTGPPELLRFLLQNGGSPTATIVERYNSCKKYRSDPSIKALDSGKIDSMKELLQHCKWEVATKANMLLEAVNKDSVDMVKVLASPDHFDPTSSRRAVNMGPAAVRQACANFKTEVVDVLLAHGCQ
ncbi:hypothetical protein IWZ03DRAFT_415602 [Phyllosticta citriasiana]|uniref:Uncharacterized protein n=1 Tax=Phyllosticta citriasiana TaxID=595635 RepID=A0ABR1KNM3_9PEZI